MLQICALFALPSLSLPNCFIMLIAGYNTEHIMLYIYIDIDTYVDRFKLLIPHQHNSDDIMGSLRLLQPLFCGLES